MTMPTPITIATDSDTSRKPKTFSLTFEASWSPAAIGLYGGPDIWSTWLGRLSHVETRPDRWRRSLVDSDRAGPLLWNRYLVRMDGGGGR